MRPFPFPKETVERLIEEKGYDDVIKINDRYVGKGHDKHCVGFVAPEVRCVVQFLLELAGETEAEGVELEDLVIIAGTYCTDNMGYDVIVYFPSAQEFAPAEVNAEDAFVDDAPIDMRATSDKLGTLLSGPRTINQSITGTVQGTALMIGNVEGQINRF